MVHFPENALSCSSETTTDTKNDNVIYQKNRDILTLPAGCLATTVLRLSCKGIQEKKHYSFDLKNRMLNGDEIVRVEMYPNNDTVTNEKVSYDKQTFTILISGGEMIADVGINFVIKTLEGEDLEFICILPIRPEGILEAGSNYNVIMGAQGPAGKASYTLSIGTVTTLEPDQQATAEIIQGENGANTLNLALVKGDQGKTGEAGKDGASYVNDGTVDLNVQSLILGNVNSVPFEDVKDGAIMFNPSTQQLVIKKNKQWIPLNMNNFTLQTSYKNNSGTTPVNFAPDQITLSKDGVSGNDGVTAGYLQFTGSSVATPTLLEVRTSFKLTTTTDMDYYIAGYNGNINIRVNPNKKTIAVYSNNTTKAYEVDYTNLGLNLTDNNFHVLSLCLNAGYRGFMSFAIDGVFFNRNYPPANFYFSDLRIRGTENMIVPANELTVKDIALSSQLPTRVNKTAVQSSFASYDGWYVCINNNVTNQQLTNGLLLKPNSLLDSFKSICPYYLNNSIVANQSLFNEEGLYSGIMSLHSTMDIPIFTMELAFKFKSEYNIPKLRRTIVGNINNMYSIGLTANSINRLTIKYHTAPDAEFTLVDALTLDEWHILAVSSNNNLMHVFVDGKLVHVRNFATNFQNLYFRALDWNQYIVDPNCLSIKHLSLLIGTAKYYKDYDVTQTPDTPTDYNLNGFFYPLVDGRLANENATSPLVNVILDENSSFKAKTVPYNEAMTTFPSLPFASYGTNNPPSVFDTKGANIYITSISGNALKETV
ncbi:phage fiber-tail adaptor protein [Commensalibacter nepenthis]|uniref:Uncharacterized protein n=1 Tax=Commensalibacter nepenthis TaxID=3043872 RepID=A0ABT6Q864_9PROT|nr:hypothetical protein [Commensalibacter sp. TBRC 10068]MDI2113094.1 hypothetical protein [Commensalibacter sp. TBRC 10068]